MRGTVLASWFRVAPLSLVLVSASLANAMPAREGSADGDSERAAFADTAAGQAPAGVDSFRPLALDEWRISYRFLGTWQSGNRIGSERVSAAEALAFDPDYESVPETRDTVTHILGLDWAPHDRITLVVRLPLHSIDEQSTSVGGLPVPDLHSGGVGDLSFGFMLPFMRKGEESSSVTLMIGAPTGSIDERGAGGLDPYPLQLGAGSWTMSPGFNYSGRKRDLSWGGQFRALFTLNDNARDYNRGTEWHATAWLGWSLADWLSASLRAGWNRQGSTLGSDARLAKPFTSPTQDAWKQSGQRIDLGPGINLRLPCCAGQRLALEAMFPLWQDLEGPQLGNRWVLNAAWQMSF